VTRSRRNHEITILDVIQLIFAELMTEELMDAHSTLHYDIVFHRRNRRDNENVITVI